MSARSLGPMPASPAGARPGKPGTVHSLDAARKKALQRARAREAAQIRKARTDPVAFAEYVMLDETTRKPIHLAQFQRDWHKYWGDHDWSVLVAPVEHGKTISVISRLLWELGRNPNLRCAWISDSEEQALKVLGVIKRYIEDSPRLRKVFPGLRRSLRPQHLWNMHAIEVDRSPYLRDPTIRVYGSGTKIAGARLDIIVLDDVLSPQNTNTLEQCQKLISWFDTVVLTRAQDQAEGGAAARIWVIGTPFVDYDLLHELPKRKSFAGRIYSAVKNPDARPHQWIPTWPEQWPIKRLLKRLNGMLPSAFARKYLCRVVTDINSRFPDWAIKRALTAGRGLRFLDRRPLLFPGPRSLPCWTGIDLGIGEEEGHDLTTLVTVALRDDMRRQVVNIESGRWTADVIVERAVEAHYRYNSRLIVESVAAQKWMLQFIRKRKIPVDPYNTSGQSKWDEMFGIESIAVELRQGLWLFPSGDSGEDIPDELAALRIEMTTYRPENHTGDRLMGLWFAREGIRRTLGKRFS
jgi:hypothetical protein